MRPRKTLGQNFLRCRWVISTLVRAAEIEPSDTVLEIGPGTGILTRVLARNARKVIAVEKDERLAYELEQHLKAEGISNVDIIPADILKILSNFPKTYNLKPNTFKVVSNIPYYLTSRLLRQLLEGAFYPARVVLTIQKEVAERIMAKPPHGNLLALSIQAFSVPQIVKIVSRDCFYPKPKVDSAIIVLSDISDNFFHKHQIQSDLFFRITRIGFGKKRKILQNTLASQISRSSLKSIWSDLGLSRTARPAELKLEQWAGIAQAFQKLEPE